MNATPLSAEEIAYYLARFGDEPGGSMSEILTRRLLATVRAREADVEVRDNDIFAAYKALGVPQTAELHTAVEALRRERDEARADTPVVAAARAWGDALSSHRWTDAVRALDALYATLGHGSMLTRPTPEAEAVDAARAEALAWRTLALARCSPVVAGIYGEREIAREVSAMRTLRALGIDPDAPEGT